MQYGLLLCLATDKFYSYDKFGYYASFAIPLSLLGLDVILRFAIIEGSFLGL